MPKLSGIFDNFKNVDQIPIDDIARWLKYQQQSIVLQNFVANRIIYPQAIPFSLSDLKIDQAILREALRRDQSYISQTSGKITIPQHFLARMADLFQLVKIFIDAYLLNLPPQFTRHIWTVSFKGPSNQTLGSILTPLLKKGGQLQIVINGQINQIRPGDLALIPCPKSHCQISFTIKGGEMFGQSQGKMEVSGGKLGLLVDGRRII